MPLTGTPRQAPKRTAGSGAAQPRSVAAAAARRQLWSEARPRREEHGQVRQQRTVIPSGTGLRRAAARCGVLRRVSHTCGRLKARRRGEAAAGACGSRGTSPALVAPPGRVNLEG